MQWYSFKEGGQGRILFEKMKELSLQKAGKKSSDRVKFLTLSDPPLKLHPSQPNNSMHPYSLT